MIGVRKRAKDGYHFALITFLYGVVSKYILDMKHRIRQIIIKRAKINYDIEEKFESVRWRFSKEASWLDINTRVNIRKGKAI